MEHNFSQVNTDHKMQIPEEPSHPDQPVTTNMRVLEVSQKPNTEKDIHPGIFIMESTLAQPVCSVAEYPMNQEVMV